MNRAEGFKAQHVENKEVKIKREKIKCGKHSNLKTFQTAIVAILLVKKITQIITNYKVVFISPI